MPAGCPRSLHENRNAPVKTPLLAVVGPTAVGKSALALELAERLGGEIVSADSRQVYRYMDVGTAKPSAGDRARVPHHLVDIVDPDKEYSFALFLRQAAGAIQDIRARGRLPILAGGSGQYVWGLLEGWTPPSVPPDPDLRRRLEAEAQEHGYAALHAQLREIDEEAAARIDPRNVRRVVRALEVACAARRRGEAHPAGSRRGASPFDSLVLGLSMDRQALYERIDDRVDAMIEAGWLDEVRGLLRGGCTVDLPSLSGLGYVQMARVAADQLSLEAAVAEIKVRTHRFARQQLGWFRRTDDRIRWFDASLGWNAPLAEAARWLDKRGDRAR